MASEAKILSLTVRPPEVNCQMLANPFVNGYNPVMA